MANPNPYSPGVMAQVAKDPEKLAALGKTLHEMETVIDQLKKSGIAWHNEATYEARQREFLASMDESFKHREASLDRLDFDATEGEETVTNLREDREDMLARFKQVALLEEADLSEDQADVLNELRAFCTEWPQVAVMVIKDESVKVALDGFRTSITQLEAQLDDLGMRLHDTVETITLDTVTIAKEELAKIRATVYDRVEDELVWLKAEATSKMERTNDLANHLLSVIETLKTRVKDLRNDYNNEFFELDTRAKNLEKERAMERREAVRRQKETVLRDIEIGKLKMRIEYVIRGLKGALVSLATANAYELESKESQHREELRAKESQHQDELETKDDEYTIALANKADKIERYRQAQQYAETQLKTKEAQYNKTVEQLRIDQQLALETRHTEHKATLERMDNVYRGIVQARNALYDAEKAKALSYELVMQALMRQHDADVRAKQECQDAEAERKAQEHVEALQQADTNHALALTEKDKQHREALEQKDSERQESVRALRTQQEETSAERDRQHATALEEEKSRVWTVLEEKITLETQAKEAAERIGILEANARGLRLEKTALEAQVKGNEQASNEKDARILGLGKDVAELRQGKTALETQVQKGKQQALAVEKENGELRLENTRLETKAKADERTSSEKDVLIQNGEERILALEKEADKLRQEKVALEMQAKEDEGHMDALWKETSELRLDKVALGKQISNEKRALAQKEAHTGYDKKQIRTFLEERSELQKQKAVLEEQAKQDGQALSDKTVQAQKDEQALKDKTAQAQRHVEQIDALERQARELREQSTLLEQRAQESEQAGKEKDTLTQRDAEHINALQGQCNGLALEQAKSLEQHKADGERIGELQQKLIDAETTRADETARLRDEHDTAVRDIASFLACTGPTFGAELEHLLRPVGQTGPFDPLSFPAMQPLARSLGEMRQRTAPGLRGITAIVGPGIAFPGRVETQSLPREVFVLAFWTLCRNGRPFTLRADHLAGGQITGDLAPMMMDSVTTLHQMVKREEPVEAPGGVLSLFLLQTILALRELERQPWPPNDPLARDVQATVHYGAFGQWLSEKLQHSPSALAESLLNYVYERGEAEQEKGQQEDWVDVAIESYAGRVECLLDSTNSDLDPGVVLLYDELGTFLLVCDRDLPGRRVYAFDVACIRHLSIAKDGRLDLELNAMIGVPEHQRVLQLSKRRRDPSRRATDGLMAWINRLPQRFFDI